MASVIWDSNNSDANTAIIKNTINTFLRSYKSLLKKALEEDLDDENVEDEDVDELAVAVNLSTSVGQMNLVLIMLTNNI